MATPGAEGVIPPILLLSGEHRRSSRRGAKVRWETLVSLAPRLGLKGGHPDPEPREGRKLGDRPLRLRSFLRRQHLGGGEPARQDLVLGLQGLDVCFEDAHKRIVFTDGTATVSLATAASRAYFPDKFFIL
jgi:hypothetical protein